MIKLSERGKKQLVRTYLFDMMYNCEDLIFTKIDAKNKVGVRKKGSIKADIIESEILYNVMKNQKKSELSLNEIYDLVEAIKKV